MSISAFASPGRRVQVTLPTNTGLEGSFRCGLVTVLDAVPLEPGEHSVYRAYSSPFSTTVRVSGAAPASEQPSHNSVKRVSPHLRLLDQGREFGSRDRAFSVHAITNPVGPKSPTGTQDFAECLDRRSQSPTSVLAERECMFVPSGLIVQDAVSVVVIETDRGLSLST